ncbi:MAG TPA: YncE family protein [Terracidiphilus sp.]|nr:YncE family protein [Terracidiphilus sp.]
MALCAQPTPRAALLVLSKQAHTLSIVDPATLKVVAAVPAGEDPHEVIASADGRTAYVSNYGFGRFHTLAVVDLVHQKALPSIDLGALRGPHGLAFAGSKVWFTAEAAKAIGSYDPATGKVDTIIGIGQNRTHMLYVFPDAKRIVTTNVNSGTVTILNRLDVPGGAPKPGAAALPGLPQGAILPPGGDWLETVVPVGTRDEGFDVSPDGREAWVANAGDGTISVVNIEAKKVVATIDAAVKTANRLKFTLDGKHVLVSLLGSPDLVVLDAATQKVVKRLPIGHGAAGILMEPGGRRAFVSCSPDNYVAVIDLKTLTVVGHIDAGGNPDGLAWAMRQ